MKFSVFAEIAVPVEAVWTWWSDFGPAGHEERVEHGFGASSIRRVVSNDGERVVLEERLPLGGARVLTHEVDIDSGSRVLRETDVGGRFVATWSFRATEAGGTRVTRDVVAEQGPGSHVPAWLARPFAQIDMDHHARECERALKT